MLFYVVTSAHCYTTPHYFRTIGRHATVKPQLIFYEQLARTSRLPLGSYIFSDLERLSPKQAEQLAAVWNALEQTKQPITLINHPTRAMRRYELLRSLYNQGINSFNAYRITELRTPETFPVFIRSEDDHGGNITPLLHTRAELAAAVAALDQQGRLRDNKLIVEYCDTAAAYGVFRKYAAFVIGEHIIPLGILFGQQWMTKDHGSISQYSPAMLEEYQTYIQNNPHGAALKAVAKQARIAYGRIDYGVRDGKLQIWEINTNPMLPQPERSGHDQRIALLGVTVERMNAAFAALDHGSRTRARIANPIAHGAAYRVVDALVRVVPRQQRPHLKHQLKLWQQHRAGLLQKQAD